ncbi:MAG TPA: BON domain-containing protein, partial [Spirochaetia bacterium]|nr:BON domain-containing protein [Spirochaetia bacterium]
RYCAICSKRDCLDINATKDCVKVIVEDGWPTLEGKVNWRCEKEAAEAAVRSFRGAVGVSIEIVVAAAGKEIAMKKELAA